MSTIRARHRYVSPGCRGRNSSNSCSPWRIREMSVPRSRSNAPVSAVSSRKVTAKVGGAITSPHSEGRPNPVVQIERIEVTDRPGELLDLHALDRHGVRRVLLADQGRVDLSQSAALLHRSREELLHVGHHGPLVPTLCDLVLLVPRLDREEMALAVDLEQGGLRAHFHTDRRCGEVLHLDHGTDGSRPRRQVRLEDRSRGVFEHADDERRGEDVNAAITHGMRRPIGADRVGDLRCRARLYVHGARVYRGKRSACKPIATSSVSMMPRKTRSLMWSSMRRPSHAPPNIVPPRTVPTITVSQVKSA